MRHQKKSYYLSIKQWPSCYGISNPPPSRLFIAKICAKVHLFKAKPQFKKLLSGKKRCRFEGFAVKPAYCMLSVCEVQKAGGWVNGRKMNSWGKDEETGCANLIRPVEYKNLLRASSSCAVRFTTFSWLWLHRRSPAACLILVTEKTLKSLASLL